MGQTLTNGIFLPNEGERNCYTGLAGNWRAIDGCIGDYNVHVADAVIHVSQADRDKWDAVDNKADASALTAHTGDTTIHVTAEDKSKWDAVTSKANDADVVHKAGAETIAGPKTFSDTVTVPSINGINPGSLSMPDLNNGIDISGYITVVVNAVKESLYTPPANGWISVSLTRKSGGVAVLLKQGNIASSGYRIDHEHGIATCDAMLPVVGGVQVLIINSRADAVVSAYFYPCLGNV